MQEEILNQETKMPEIEVPEEDTKAEKEIDEFDERVDNTNPYNE